MPVLAIAALLVVGLSWLLDAFYGLRPIGTLPLAYDLALAFLTGVVFQFLVVYLPERRRSRATVELLRAPLQTAALNGEGLIRDLEFIGRCPERDITPEHIELVVRANNDNDANREAVAERLSVARDAYRKLAPYLLMLPRELVVELDKVERSFLNFTMNVPDTFSGGPSRLTAQPFGMRTPSPVWMLTTSTPIPSRNSMFGFAAEIQRYYEAAERLREALDRYVSGPPEEGRPEGALFWYFHRHSDSGHPFRDYPPEAFTTEWLPHYETESPPPIPDRRATDGSFV